MNALFNNLKNDKMIFFSLIATTVFIVLNLTIILFFYQSLPPYIPLYNQMPWGEPRLGTKIEIFIPSVLILAIIIFNFFISGLYYQKIPLISRLFTITSLLISFLGFILIIRTVRIII